jgi:UDP-N-acetylmuramate dehydrogenase
MVPTRKNPSYILKNQIELPDYHFLLLCNTVSPVFGYEAILPMNLLQDADVISLNTLNLGTSCSEVRLVTYPDEMLECLFQLDVEERSNVKVCGELSNTVIGEVVNAPLIIFRDGQNVKIEKNAGSVIVKVHANFSFDRLVNILCEEGISGVEMLSGIPGTVGAAVVQNIAAYGQKISDVFLSARAFDIATGAILNVNGNDLQFSYRSSALKPRDRYTPQKILLDVALKCDSPDKPQDIQHTEILTMHREYGRQLDSLVDRRTTVLQVRERKGMVVGGANWLPTAGSYFLSPVLPKEVALDLARQIRGRNFSTSFLSWYQPDATTTRFPAALAMRASGFMNGDRWGNVGLSPYHILAICTYPEATGSDVVALGDIIRTRVSERLGIILEPEVRLLGDFTRENLENLRREFVQGVGEPAWALGLGAPDEGSG